MSYPKPLMLPPPGTKPNQQAIAESLARVLREDWQGPLEQPPFIYDSQHGYVRNPLCPRGAK